MAYAVITRSGSAEYAEAIAPLGLQLVEMPVTRPEPVAHRFDGGYEIIAVASAKAATAVATIAGVPAIDVWAVGLATQRVLREHGIHAQTQPGVVDGASLAAAIVAHRSVVGVRVLIPRAEDGRPELAETLRAAGAIVDEVIVYRTVAVTTPDLTVGDALALLLAKHATVVILLAPSQVRALVGLVGPLRDLRDTTGADIVPPTFVALGETTAAALRDEGVTPIVAAIPTPAGIATALAAVYPHRT